MVERRRSISAKRKGEAKKRQKRATGGSRGMRRTEAPGIRACQGWRQPAVPRSRHQTPCELALTPACQELKWKLGERRRLDQRTTDDHVRPTQIETWSLWVSKDHGDPPPGEKFWRCRLRWAQNQALDPSRPFAGSQRPCRGRPGTAAGADALSLGRDGKPPLCLGSEQSWQMSEWKGWFWTVK